MTYTNPEEFFRDMQIYACQEVMKDCQRSINNAETEEEKEYYISKMEWLQLEIDDLKGVM
jgi:hypothetical protein